MSLFSQARRTVRETALVITADRVEESHVFRTIVDKRNRCARHLTAQQTAYKAKLAGV